MKKNISNADKYIRFILAALFLTLYFTDIVTGTLGIVLVAVGIIFAATGVMNFCPIYFGLGLSTCKVEESKTE